MARRVRWNEANLSEIEANKVVRKKIDEPKTPYHPLLQDQEDDDHTVKRIDYAAHAEALKTALSRVALSHDQLEGGTGQANCQASLGKQGDEASFAERRRAHYDDEFKAVKLLQRQKDCSVDDHGSCAREIDIEEDSDNNIDEILHIINIEENGRPASLAKIKLL